jgi:DNA-directed RNA polymerase subunit RPC12/RpoP
MRETRGKMSAVQAEKAKAGMQEAFEQMWDEWYDWRAEHAGASFDEIAAQVTPRRRALIGQVLAQLASQHGEGEVVEGVRCPDCGQAMSYKGKPRRGVEHLEGETELERAYYYCARCESGLFRPG